MEREPKVNIKLQYHHMRIVRQSLNRAMTLFFLSLLLGNFQETFPLSAAEKIKIEKPGAEIPPTTQPGEFPLPKRCELKYRLGWSGLTAARASIQIVRTNDLLRIEAEGGTVGLARGIYKVDFNFLSELKIDGLDLQHHRLVEQYRKVRVENEAVITPAGLCLTRKGFPSTSNTAEKERFYAINDAVDMPGALLRFRSLPLRPGDKATARVCHGDRIYVAKIEVQPRETLMICGLQRRVIPVALSLSKMNKKGGLEPHKRFRSAIGWFSDDDQRDLLRVEGEIFIGKLFAELQLD